MSEPITSVDLTAAELHLIKNALDTYLSVFGHEDADLLGQTHAAIAKFAAVTVPDRLPQAAG